MAEPLESYEPLMTAARSRKRTGPVAPIVAMAAAGILAFVSFIAVTNQNRATIQVAVASSDIPYGTSAKDASVGYTNIFVKDSEVSGLLTQTSFNQLKTVTDVSQMSVATRTIPKGTLLFAADFAHRDSAQPTFSFSVSSADANGGDIRANDLIDFVNEQGCQSGYQLKVISVSSQSGGAVQGAGQLLIRIAVPNERVSAAVKQTLGSKFKVVMDNNNPPIAACPGSN